MPAKKTTSNTRKPQRGGAKKNSSGGDSKQLVRDVTGVVILCLGVLSVYFAFTPNAVGFPGVVRSIMTGLAGVLCFAIPIILCWAALILLFSTRQRRISPVRVALLSALIAIVFGVFELFAMDGLLADLRQTNYASFLLHAFRAQTGGGLIGAITVWPLYIGLGLHVAGSLIVYIALALIDLILLRKISMSRIRERAVDGLANVQQHMTQQREARAERREARFERREAERLIRAQEMVIPSVAPAGEQPKKAPNTAQDAFSAKETPVASKAAAKAPVVETVEPPTSARSTARPVREKPIVAEAPRRSAPVLPVREAQAGPAAPEDEPPFDPQDDLFDGRAQEPFPGAFAGARGAQKPAAKAQPEAFFKADEVVYETALHIADEEDDAPLDEEEDFILPSPEDFDAPEEAEEEYIPGSRLIEKEHVYKNEPAQPLSSYSAEKEMRAPIHTDMLLHEEEEAQDEPVDIPAAEPKSSSLFGDRLRRANAAYDAQKAAQSAPAEQSAPRSPMGSGLASGPENVPFSQNEIFGVHKSAAQAAPEPPPYNYPPVDLLAQAKPSKARNQEAIDLEKGRRLVEVLLSFGITTKLTGVSHGPTVTRFELAPAPGIKVSRITSLVDDIALGLAAKSVRIEAPIPGKPAVGVEVPNDEIETVQLRDVLESPEAQKHPSRIAAAIGRDNAGRNILCDLAKMPHILIAGATGAGKSVCINCIICSILYRATPEEVRLIMIDPKMVELSVYNEIPHLLVPVVTDPKKAAGALEWVVNEMTQRYRKFAASGTKDIKGYNLKRPEYEPAMPQIVVIIDELADLMMVAPGDVEDAICRIAQLARAAGIHLVIATQRPSVNVITGVIKANIPSRIAFTVASQVDSRTILDIGGAEKLLGRGDMLYAPSGTNKPQRVQGAWISENEVQAVVQYIRDRHEADYSEDLTEHLERADMSDAEKEEAEEQHDDLLPQAIEFVVEAGQASISMLQRKMRIGYARAGRLIDEMARRGFISEADGAKPREVLITREQFRAMFKE